MSVLKLIVALVGLLATSVLANAGREVFVLPEGSGSKDGSSWKNALDASAGSLQKTLDAGGFVGVIWIGSGNYFRVTTKVKRGGESGKYLKIVGKDTGGGLPIFVGSFDKRKPADSGETFLDIEKGVSDLWIQDIQLLNYQLGINARGSHQNLRIINVDSNGCRECMSFNGGATPARPQDGSKDIEIANCDYLNYTKRGLRIFNGNSNVKIINSTADAGGKDWATESFQIGFQVSKVESETEKYAADHDITFINCVSRNNYDDAGDKYWNADGFVAEPKSYNLRFINCMAFDNTDGGWDDKSTGTTYDGCIAFRNKRNFRVWGEVKMFRTIGGYSVFPGGSGDDLGIWASGKVVAESSTFHNNGIGIKVVENGSVTLVNSILSRTKEVTGQLVKLDGDKARFVNNGSILWSEGDPARGPDFLNAIMTWDGIGKNFDSRNYGTLKGYFSR